MGFSVKSAFTLRRKLKAIVLYLRYELITGDYHMRKKEDRTSQILNLLVKERKLEVAQLSAHLGVSQVTVRKDLDAME